MQRARRIWKLVIGWNLNRKEGIYLHFGWQKHVAPWPYQKRYFRSVNFSAKGIIFKDEEIRPEHRT